MLSRTVSRILPRGARAFSEAGPSSNLVLNFNLPDKEVYLEKEVASVIVPGLAGEYGVTAGHAPIISQMKAGVLQIEHIGESETEKYFVPGGFAISHHDDAKGSFTDISCPEAVKVDDIDGSAAASAYSESKRAFDSAEEGSAEKALAQIDMEVNKAMAEAVGSSVA